MSILFRSDGDMIGYNDPYNYNPYMGSKYDEMLKRYNENKEEIVVARQRQKRLYDNRAKVENLFVSILTLKEVELAMKAMAFEDLTDEEQVQLNIIAAKAPKLEDGTL